MFISYILFIYLFTFYLFISYIFTQFCFLDLSVLLFIDLVSLVPTDIP